MSRFHVGEICQVKRVCGLWGECTIMEAVENSPYQWLIECPDSGLNPDFRHGLWAGYEAEMRKIPRDGDANFDFHEFMDDLRREIPA